MRRSLRLAGDEFVVVLEDIEGAEEVEQVTARMQEVLSQPFAISGQRIRITTSIGVALYPRDAETLSLLIERSDLAMYRAKALGRNGVQFYTPDLANQRKKAKGVQTTSCNPYPDVMMRVPDKATRRS